MAKYIDSNEQRRKNRLKNTKSSIGSTTTSHSGWQKSMIEKRRKEQLRQKRRDAKKKQLGTGIQVENKVSKSDAVSKCGLKLKVIDDTVSVGGRVQEEKKTRLPPQIEASQKIQSNLRLNQPKQVPKKQADNKDRASKNVGLPRLGDRLTVNNRKSVGPNQRRQGAVHNNQRFPADEGKENSDNSANNRTNDSAPNNVLKKPTEVNKDTGHAAVLKRQTGAKKYFTGLHSIESLRAEHADAIKMLEELDKKENNRRKSLDSDNSSYTSEDDAFPSKKIFDESYRENSTLDEDFVRDW